MPPTKQQLLSVSFDTYSIFKRLCLLVFGSVLMLAGTAMLVGGLLIWKATRPWPETKARILQCEIVDAQSSRRVRLDLKYEYTVDGRPLTGTGLSPVVPDNEVTSREARHWQQTYPQGSQTTACYDPDLPQRVFLVRPDLTDVLLYPLAVTAFGAWLLLVCRQTRRNRVPATLVTPSDYLHSDDEDIDADEWAERMSSPLILSGTIPHPKIGGLMSGWPECHTAVVISSEQFAVIPGPYTRRGIASCFVTLLLELSVSMVWLPAFHSLLILVESGKRYLSWARLNDQRFPSPGSADAAKHSTSIADAVVYGFDETRFRLWFRQPNSLMDEFVQLSEDDVDDVEEALTLIQWLQQPEAVDSGSPSSDVE